MINLASENAEWVGPKDRDQVELLDPSAAGIELVEAGKDDKKK